MSVIPFPEPPITSGQQLNVFCAFCSHSKTFHVGKERCVVMKGDEDGVWVCGCPGWAQENEPRDTTEG